MKNNENWLKLKIIHVYKEFRFCYVHNYIYNQYIENREKQLIL